jgi:hypothetical protein
MREKPNDKELNKELNKELCQWCGKELSSTQTHVVFATKKKSCLKCYHNSGASLPMFRK